MCSWLCSVTVCKRPLHSKRLHVLAAVPVRHHCIPLYQLKIPILKSLVPLSASFHVGWPVSSLSPKKVSGLSFPFHARTISLINAREKEREKLRGFEKFLAAMW
ncbi:hypothetical protein VNO80_29639 [Phaseolus coccineus]|uniref:Uncharacterized protein n=1 Tax=Phaseolus coccineus TaxID=3886 RepID=A0AAN9QIP5_PHACN